MWSFDRRNLLRVIAVAGLGGLTAGCFRPLYGDPKVVPTAGLDDKLATVDIVLIDVPPGSRIARVGMEVRNALLFEANGGVREAAQKRYRLNIRLSANQQQVIVDINSARPDVQNYGIEAAYTLTDMATSKPVFHTTTFARVSYDIPGQQQRFAGERGLRDAENRAARVIADNIRARLASFFVAGT